MILIAIRVPSTRLKMLIYTKRAVRASKSGASTSSAAAQRLVPEPGPGSRSRVARLRSGFIRVVIINCGFYLEKDDFNVMSEDGYQMSNMEA